MKKLRHFFLSAFIFIPVIAMGSVANSQPDKSNWYDNLIFKDPSFNFEFIRALGYTYSQGADIGETIDTAKRIKEGDFNSWYTEWFKTAQRLEALANTFNKEGHVVSAREAYFRAANYYRSAGFYMVAPEDRAKSINAYQKSKENFLKGIASLPYVDVVHIPYEKTLLPAYFIRSEKPNAPIVIVNTGFDGTAEELFFEVGKALYDRDYNALLIEGPGQGGVLRERNLAFRPDWEKVITPVVNFIETLPHVNKDKIALMGISMGGYLAPRAAAFEPRIKALIANGGVYDFGEVLFQTLPMDVLNLVDSDPQAFNKVITEQMQKSTEVRWFFDNGMWTFHADSPAEFVKLLRSYNLKDSAKKIKATSLIIDGEADTFMKGQAPMLYKNLTSPKTFLLFTREQAAQSHCQMGANAISNELVLNWLDKTLKTNWNESNF